MTDRLKGVIAGAGYFAGFHADGWNRMSTATIAAVADADFERARAFAVRWGIPASYASVEEMMERERPDFVDIATRPDSHVSLTAAAARAGVHVICQKPMAPSPADCRAMVDTCAQAGVRLIVHENWRWQPWYRELKRLLDEDRFGPLFHAGFQIRTGDGRGPVPYTVQPYFRDMERFFIYEALVHFLDTLRYLVGEIRTVYCQAGRINPVIRGEDYVLMQLTFASGVRGLIDANRISGPVPPAVAFGSLRLEGDRAMARTDPEGRLWICDYGCAESEHRFTAPEEGYKGDSVRAFQEHAIACLAAGRPAESEGAEYLKTVDAVFGCYRSIETGAVAALE